MAFIILKLIIISGLNKFQNHLTCSLKPWQQGLVFTVICTAENIAYPLLTTGLNGNLIIFSVLLYFAVLLLLSTLYFQAVKTIGGIPGTVIEYSGMLLLAIFS